MYMMMVCSVAQAARPKLLTAKTWVQPRLRFILGTEALKRIYFRVLSVLFIIPPLLYTYFVPPLDVLDSPDQAVHYHILRS
jgi:hypothetical protein